MSLVCAENSDEIGCALHVFIRATEVCDTSVSTLYAHLSYLLLNALDILSRNSLDFYVVHGVNVLGSSSYHSFVRLLNRVMIDKSVIAYSSIWP